MATAGQSADVPRSVRQSLTIDAHDEVLSVVSRDVRNALSVIGCAQHHWPGKLKLIATGYWDAAMDLPRQT